MPTYEYTCKKCGDNIEVFQSFSAKPLKKHQICGGDLQKVFHARGVVFKGSGWYTKDSKTSSTASNGSKKADESKPKKSDETKTSTGTKDEKTAASTSTPSTSD